MAFAISEFIRLRPFAYHVTNRDNAKPLRTSKRIRTTQSLLQDGDHLHLLRKRRTEYVSVTTAGGVVVLKDQKPLIEANTALTHGWAFGDYVAFLNGFTFFWPGTDLGPIGQGRRLLDHYEADGPLVLRIATTDLFSANVNLTPEFCAFNSGAPRYNAGKPASRGPDLFAPAHEFPRRASEVAELAFRGDVVIPTTAEYRNTNGWSLFFTE
ncbi:MAG TPA: hypothetical protein VGM82_00090 [Gemmatimonadaceae bacterium]|jgi:hypothetical protein